MKTFFQTSTRTSTQSFISFAKLSIFRNISVSPSINRYQKLLQQPQQPEPVQISFLFNFNLLLLIKINPDKTFSSSERDINFGFFQTVERVKNVNSFNSSLTFHDNKRKGFEDETVQPARIHF